MLSPPAQVLWDAMMWRCTRAQLQEVAGRIRAARATLPAEDLARLRQMYAIRRDQVGEGRPMDNPPSVTQLFHTVVEYVVVQHRKCVDEPRLPAWGE